MIIDTTTAQLNRTVTVVYTDHEDGWIDCGHDTDATCRYCGCCHACDPFCADDEGDDRWNHPADR